MPYYMTKSDFGFIDICLPLLGTNYSRTDWISCVFVSLFYLINLSRRPPVISNETEKCV